MFYLVNFVYQKIYLIYSLLLCRRLKATRILTKMCYPSFTQGVLLPYSIRERGGKFSNPLNTELRIYFLFYFYFFSLFEVQI